MEINSMSIHHPFEVLFIEIAPCMDGTYQAFSAGIFYERIKFNSTNMNGANNVEPTLHTVSPSMVITVNYLLVRS